MQSSWYGSSPGFWAAFWVSGQAIYWGKDGSISDIGPERFLLDNQSNRSWHLAGNSWAGKTYFGNISINTVIEDLGISEILMTVQRKRMKCSTKGRRHKHGRCKTKCGRDDADLKQPLTFSVTVFPHTQERWKPSSFTPHMTFNKPLNLSTLVCIL